MGAISWRGLIPADYPIFVDDWLEESFRIARGEKRTVTSDRYVVLIRNIAGPSVLHRYPNGDAIFQDEESLKNDHAEEILQQLIS